MTKLDSDKLYDYLSKAARDGRLVTEDKIVSHFGAELGAVKKRFALLTGNCVLIDLGQGTYDCSNVLKVPKSAFQSAGSQGKGNQAYVRSLLAEIERLKKNNDTMRERLLEAQQAKK
jgi:hypothetical protein